MGMSKKNPTYEVMVFKAVLEIRDYIKGASRPAIKKYIEQTYKITASTAALRRALKKGVDSKALTQEGQRFKLDPAKRAELRKPAPKPKKKKKVAKKKKKKKTVKKKKDCQEKEENRKEKGEEKDCQE